MLKKFVSKEPVLKGWSGDKKYCLTDEQGNRFLLRVTPIEKYDEKMKEYELMHRVAELGVPMCDPLEFGTCDKGVYSIQTWIDGEDAETIMPNCPAAKQYAYGMDAGRFLRKIHSIPAPETQEDWEARFNRKIARKTALYEACPIKYENGQAEAFIDYINNNRSLLADRPQTFQHGDYHIGNMMIGRDGKLYIIDFNRCDFGDPWEEFNRIVWCAQNVPVFASGMVDGYFDGAVPADFWQLLALYISSNTLSSLPWAVPFGEKEIATMRNQATDVFNWYNGMNDPVPTWYRKCC